MYNQNTVSGSLQLLWGYAGPVLFCCQILLREIWPLQLTVSRILQRHTILTVSQLLCWEADAGWSGVALRGASHPGLRVVEVMVSSQPPRLGQTARRSGALQEFAPLQGHAVVWRSEVRRPRGETSWGTYYSVCEAQIPQSQTLVAWRGGRRSTVTLILGGGSDTVHWMEVDIKRKEGWRGVRDEEWKGGVWGVCREGRNKKKVMEKLNKCGVSQTQ